MNEILEDPPISVTWKTAIPETDWIEMYLEYQRVVLHHEDRLAFLEKLSAAWRVSPDAIKTKFHKLASLGMKFLTSTLAKSPKKKEAS